MWATIDSFADNVFSSMLMDAILKTIAPQVQKQEDLPFWERVKSKSLVCQM
jgi:hypothetical protein